jgi:hypothetical protein
VLTAALLAYVAYVVKARLARRIKLDRARLAGLRFKGRTRRGAINAFLAWALLATITLQAATGLALYLGYGDVFVTVHLTAALVLIALPVVHVAAHWTYGGLPQVLRIVRPQRLGPVPQTPSLAELVAAEFARDSENARTIGGNRRDELRTPTRGTVLRVHPLALATAVGMSVMVAVLAVDRSGGITLVFSRIERSQAPQLDGDLSDPVWRKAHPVTVLTNQGANLGGSGTSRVEIRAVHDGEIAYLAFTWDDPSRSLKHLPLIKREDGWYLLHRAYDIEDEDDYYEDKFGVMLSTNDRMTGGGSTHLGSKPLAGKPAAYSGRGLHYTDDGSIVDVWHWKATRGGLIGHIDDNYFGPPAAAKPAEIEGKSRYKAGYATDPGKASFSNNFKAEPAGGYRKPLQPIRLPKNLADLRAAMGRVDLAPDQGEEEGARWWMTDAESVPYSVAIDQRIPVGTVIPGITIAGEYAGDRADVRCAARWSAGRWTLEVARRLDTKSKYDVALVTGHYMWVAVFDHTQTRHTRHIRPVRLEIEP